MRQKELLQARLVAYMGAESEDDRSKKTEISNKKISESEIILLDYSSEEKDEKSRKRQRSDSKTIKEKNVARDQKIDEKRKEEKAKEAHRSRKDNDNRYKEDLRKEIDRDKVRFFREREKIKDDRDRRNNLDRRNTDQNRQRPGTDMNKMRRLSTDGRDRRDYSREDEYRQDRGRNRYSYQDKNRRGRNSDQKDKFKGSLSEGLKDKNSSSSGSEMDITDLNDDEDDEEKIIAQRRKQRMELLKKLGNTEDNGKYIDEKEKSSSPIVSQNIETYELNDGTLSSTEIEAKTYDSLTPPFPPGIKADVSNKEIIDDKNALCSKNKEIKRSEWDMFAEQDIDSNFDVSLFILKDSISFLIFFL